MRRRDILALAGAAAFGAACRPSDASSAKERRLVVVGSALTEIVFALGDGKDVVAVDVASLYPDEARALATLGYHRKLSADGILATTPTHLLVSSDAGPPEALTQIAGAGIKVDTIEVPLSWPAAVERVRVVGGLLSKKDAAERLASELDETLRTLETEAKARQQRLRALYVFAPTSTATMVAGRNTAADVVLGLAGLDNAGAELDGFRPWTPEAAVAARPDLVVVSQEGIQRLGGVDALFARPGLRESRAAESRRVAVVDDMKFLGLGPRVAEATRDLVKIVYAS